MNPRVGTRKRSRVVNLQAMKHGDAVQLVTNTAPQKVIVTGTLEGQPWSSKNDGVIDMVQIKPEVRPQRGDGIKDYSVKEYLVYRLN